MEIQYKGYLVETTEKSHCAVIMKGDDIVKCIAGNIMADGSTDKIEKAKAWIDAKGLTDESRRTKRRKAS